ncbi:hypothetical protein BLNAU_21800 [Blattamonas nauphoetae]|uniref:Uncharacterized protein n=2 Tax=Blattamonas nauphoetae TaxID=2049346 RepID=A0ABQ9WUX2_9EUKA|nr:hypothetical protein BLNAU_21800 [Blattamonas nauphoetae]
MSRIFAGDEYPDEDSLLDTLHHLNRTIRSLSLSNNNRFSFPPNVRFIVETDSLENVPQYLLSACRVLTVPASFLMHAIVTFPVRSLSPSDPHFSCAYMYVMRMVVSVYGLNRPVSASYLSSPRFVSVMYQTIANAVTLFVHWLRIAFSFLQDSTVADPNDKKRLVIDRSCVDNHSKQMFTNSLTLFTAVLVSFIDKISLSVATRSTQKANNSNKTGITLQQSIENTIVYALYWGMGAHLFHLHDFRCLFSDKLCSLLSSPPIFRTEEPLKQFTDSPVVVKDLHQMSNYLGFRNHGLNTRECLFSFCINSTDGSWLPFPRINKAHPRVGKNTMSPNARGIHHSSSDLSGGKGQTTTVDSTALVGHSYGDIMPDVQMLIAPYSHIISLYLSVDSPVLLAYQTVDSLEIISKSILLSPYTPKSSLDATFQLFDLNVTERTTHIDFHRLMRLYRAGLTRSRDRLVKEFEQSGYQSSRPVNRHNHSESVSTEESSGRRSLSKREQSAQHRRDASTVQTELGTQSTYDELNRATGASLLSIHLQTPIPQFALSQIRSIINQSTIVLDSVTDTYRHIHDELNVIVTLPLNAYHLMPNRFIHKMPLITTPEVSLPELLYVFNCSFSRKVNSILSLTPDTTELPPPFNRIPSITLMLCLFLGYFQRKRNLRLSAFFRHMLPTLLLFPPSITHGLEVLQLLSLSIAASPQVKNSRSSLTIEWIKCTRSVFSQRCTQAEKVRMDIIITFFGSYLMDASPFDIKRLRELVRFLCTYDTRLGEEVLFLEEHKSEDYHRFIQLYDRPDMSMGQFLQSENNPFVLSTFNESTGIRLFRVKQELERHHVFVLTTPHLITNVEVNTIISMTGYVHFHLNVSQSFLRFLSQLRTICQLLMETDKHVVVSLYLDDVAALDTNMRIYQAHQQESKKPLTSQHIPNLSRSTIKTENIRGSERVRINQDSAVSHVTPPLKTLRAEDISSYLHSMLTSSTFFAMLFSESEVQAMTDHLYGRNIILTNTSFHSYLLRQSRAHLRLLIVGNVVEPYLETQSVGIELERHSLPTSGISSSYLHKLQKSPRLPPQKAHTSSIMYSPCLACFEWFIRVARFVFIENMPFNSLVRKACSFVSPVLPVKLAYHAKKASNRKGTVEAIFPFPHNNMSDYLLALGGDPLRFITSKLSLNDRYSIDTATHSGGQSLSKQKSRDALAAILTQTRFGSIVEARNVKPTFPPLTHPPLSSLPIGPGLFTTYAIKHRQKPTLVFDTSVRRILRYQSSQANLAGVRPLIKSASQSGFTSTSSLSRQQSSLSNFHLSSFQVEDDYRSHTRNVSPHSEEVSFASSPSIVSLVDTPQRSNSSYRRIASLMQLETHSYDRELETRLKETLLHFPQYSENIDLLHLPFEQSLKMLDEFTGYETPFSTPRSKPRKSDMLSVREVTISMVRPLVFIFNTMKHRSDYFSWSFTSTTSGMPDSMQKQLILHAFDPSSKGHKYFTYYTMTVWWLLHWTPFGTTYRDALRHAKKEVGRGRKESSPTLSLGALDQPKREAKLKRVVFPSQQNKKLNRKRRHPTQSRAFIGRDDDFVLSRLEDGGNMLSDGDDLNSSPHDLDCQLSSHSQNTNSSTSELSPFFEMDDYLVESMNCLPIHSNTIPSTQFPLRMVRISSTKSSPLATPSQVFTTGPTLSPGNTNS